MDITEITRRAIADELTVADIAWSGSLGDDDFLARLYDLSAMPSHDGRYQDAAGDIWKHMVMNRDWEVTWVFTDSRFNLLRCPDEEFLRFLCETIHPVVRSKAEDVTSLRDIYNRRLAADGWELYEQTAISGRPVFAARHLLDGATHAIDAAKFVADTLSASYVNQQVTRLQASVMSDPELAIGTAKEFIETIAKTILERLNKPWDKDWDLTRLIRRAMEELGLVPASIDSAAKGAETIKRMLGSLSSIAQCMAELRNPYGTGHGKSASSRGLQARHARLAVGAATTLAVFLFETYQERNPGG